MKLESRVAIITGGGSGIGQAIAVRLSENGANIVIADVDLKAAQTTVSKIKASGHDAIATKTDISDKAQLIEMKDRCLKQYGTIDILVNNAGIMSPPTPIEDLSEEYWDKIVEVNLKGTFLCTQIVGREMIKNKRGCVINIASMCGLGPYPKGGAYGPTKAAIILLTQQIALEWAPYNIRVNSISPGTIVTPLNAMVYADEEIYKKRADIIPLHRPGKPEDIANTALFLASDDSSYITGTDILVDGGLMKIAQQVLPGRAGKK